MASSKSSSSVINEKHMATINEMKAELGTTKEDLGTTKSALIGNNVVMAFSNAVGKSQATMRALTMNNGVGPIKFQEKKDWSGTVVGSYPPNVPVNRSGKSTHQGVPPKDANGSMGAVVYVGPNVQGQPPNCAWILAWSVPGDGSPNKIYVETGPCTKYPPGDINWDAIKDSLDKSKNESHCRDDGTGAEASANIDPTGNTPAVAAVFDVSLK